MNVGIRQPALVKVAHASISSENTRASAVPVMTPSQENAKETNNVSDDAFLVAWMEKNKLHLSLIDGAT